MKIEDKKSQIRWNTTMDNVLLDMLIEAVKSGKKKGKKWDNKVWDSVSLSLSQLAKEEIQVKHIENRLRQMKSEFTNFLELKNKSGASYDSVKQMVLVSNDYWKDLLAHPKEKKKFKVFQDRGLKWDLEKLSLVFGNSHATGSYSHNGLDEMQTTDTGEENMNIDVEGSEENTPGPTTKVMHSKRQHGKRSRPIDDVKDMFDKVTSELELLRHSIDLMVFGRQVREAVMGVEGFSHRYLNTSFLLLMKEEAAAIVCLLTDDEGKRDMLNDLRSRVGNI